MSLRQSVKLAGRMPPMSLVDERQVASVRGAGCGVRGVRHLKRGDGQGTFVGERVGDR